MSIELGDYIAENWMAYGMSLHEMEKYPDAIEAFDKALKINPKMDDAKKWRDQSAKRLIKEGDE